MARERELAQLGGELQRLEQEEGLLDQHQANFEEQVEQDRQRVSGLEVRGGQIISILDQGEAKDLALADQWSQVANRWEATARLYTDARSDWQQAAENAKVPEYIVLASIASACIESTVMSTATFRRLQGIDDPDIHIDHIIPRARGGIDSPFNYQAIPAQQNLSYGAGGLAEKLLNDPVRFSIAGAASILGKPVIGPAAGTVAAEALARPPASQGAKR
jgi:hypothetical protein